MFFEVYHINNTHTTAAAATTTNCLLLFYYVDILTAIMLTTFKSIGSLEKACKGVSMNLFQHCSMSAVETHNLVVKGHDNIRNLKYINLYDPGLQKTIVGEVQYSSISNADQTTIQFKV